MPRSALGSLTLIAERLFHHRPRRPWSPSEWFKFHRSLLPEQPRWPRSSAC